MSNTSAGIEAKIFLHEVFQLDSIDMGPPPNDSLIHGDQMHA